LTRIPRDPTERPAKGAGKKQFRAAKAAPAETQTIVHGEVPPREVLLRFIAENPQQASKREIAKAFGLKGEARVELKALLRSLEEDGLVEKKRKSLIRPGGLPPVTVLDITIRDIDGELIGRPAEWLDDDGVAPAVLIKQSAVAKAKGKVPVAGLGDRVLAKIFPAKERGGPAYTARIIKILDKRQDVVLGVFRSTPGGGRLLPIYKRG
jgi:ribonuclease R